MTKLTDIQFLTAHRFARCHYHEWACGYYDPLITDLRDPDTIAEVVFEEFRRLASVAIGPIQFGPVMGGSNVVHTTGTGRTTWSIAPSGGVEIQITRPGDEVVLSATITPDGAVIEQDHGKPYYGRHVEALEWAEHLALCQGHTYPPCSVKFVSALRAAALPDWPEEDGDRQSGSEYYHAYGEEL